MEDRALGGGQQSKSMYAKPRPRRVSGGPSASIKETVSAPKTKTTTYSFAIEGDDGGIEMRHACRNIHAALSLRDKYKTIDKGQREPNEKLTPPVTLQLDDGVFVFTDQRTAIVPWEQFYDDVIQMMKVIQNPQCYATCKYRLQVLEEKFNMYKIANAELEEGLDRYRRGGGVFADSTKVDNNVYLSSSVNAMILLGHIQATYDREADVVVRYVGDRKEPQTLRRMFEVSDLQDPSQLTVEGLGLHPSTDRRLLRFDVLDPDMNRAGKGCADILRLFLTRKNLRKGEYFAEAVRPVLSRSENRNKYVECSEMVMELLGTSEDDWDTLAKWFAENQLHFPNTNRWIVALPRQAIRRESFTEKPEGVFEFHQKHIENIFLPLFAATLAPEDPKNVDIAQFLLQVGAIMIVSDEEVRESDFTRKRRKPGEVPWTENVCDLYFAYYVWANLASLNAFRRRKGLNVIQFRAVAGQRSTQLDSLVYSYLLADSISQGLLLQEQHVLQYLYGIQKIGVCMSPIGQNALQIPYMDNPFPTFFRRGLMLSLCTDHPLYFHHSQDALVEEYATCTKFYKLAPVDMCELAHNSVMISSFSEQSKSQWLGESYIHEGTKGNSIEFSNVPTSRLELRAESWATEVQIILKAIGESHPTQDAPLISSKLPYVVTDPHVQFPRIVFSGPFERDTQHSQVAQLLHKALEMRKLYVWGAKSVNRTSIGALLFHQHDQIENAFKRNDTFDEDEWKFKTVEGIVVPHEVHQIPRLPKEMFRFEEFRIHVQELRNSCENIHVKNFAIRRLNLLEHKFRLHLAVNHSIEAGSTAEKASQNRDFYQATKVDTNVRMENGMTARHLLSFIISKANNNGDDIVSQEKGKEPQTLRQLLHELRISPNFLTVDDLNVQVDATTANGSEQQFTPAARDPLLTLLLKTDNQMKGRYFAELTKLTFENFKRDKFTFAENRLPVYGANRNEWPLLSDWFDTHGMASVNNQWMVQIPRIYGFLRRNGKVNSFAEYIENIFTPLWNVSLHPSENPRLFHFVNHISGFDCIENEQRVDVSLSMALRPPQEWTSEEEPPYNYYLYYIWANVFSLNEFRQRRNFTTFSFRPSCGETGSMEHLIGGFLLTNAINYGVRLKDEPVLQYLFYLSQIGVAVSPLSNNTKVLDFLDNPFPTFFRRGLNVSLSTEAPLQHHYTQEPLLEEYSIASKVWKLSPNDMCEIARNSVLQSGFDTRFKQERLGEFFFLSSSRSNDATRTHLSDVRVAYRYDTYHTELSLLEHVSGLRFERAMSTSDEESKKALEWQEAKRKQVETSLGGIIDSHQDEADIQKLNSQRSLMVRQMEDLRKNLQDLQRQNKQLAEKLAEETSKDQAAQQLRRQADADRVNAVSEAEARRHRQLENFEDKPFEQSESDESSDEEAVAPAESQLEETRVGGNLLDVHATSMAGSEHEDGKSSSGTSWRTQDPMTASARRTNKVYNRTAALVGASEDFFTNTSTSPLVILPTISTGGQESGMLTPTPPPRTGVTASVATTSDDALSEFLKRSHAELDRMATGRRQSAASQGRQVRVMSASETAFVSPRDSKFAGSRSSSAR